MKTRADIIAYLRSVSDDLADLADSQRLDMMAYLFRMAKLEAEKLAVAPPDIRRLTKPESAAAPFGYWDWDISHDRMFGDEHAAGLFNIDRDAGRRGSPLSEWQRAVHSDDVEHVGAQLMNSIETGSEYNPRFRVIGPDQTIRHVEAHGRCLFDAQGRPSRFPGTIRQVHASVARLTDIEIDVILRHGRQTH